MARIKAPYNLYPRKLKSGKKVWYYQARDPSGKRLPGRSTGESTKGEARNFCDKLLKSGRLASPKVPTLSEWAQDRRWYEWDRDDPSPACLYCKGRLARSSKERPALGRGHVDRCRTYLQTHILPAFGSERLDRVEPAQLEEWLFRLAELYAQKTVNNIASAFRSMTSEAFRLSIIDDDPWKRVPLFAGDSKPRGTVTISEALKLMDPSEIDSIWKGNRLNYLMNLAAMLTGRREGELLALLKDNLHDDHIDVEASWTIRYHERGPTKTKVKAPIPIPKYLYKALTEFAIWDGYVFSYTKGHTPATGARVADALYDALEKIGVDKDERKRRNIVFHSWRKFANSYLRSRGVPDAKIRLLTLHKTEAMTDHYTNWNPEGLRDVSHEQELLANALSDPRARSTILNESNEVS